MNFFVTFIGSKNFVPQAHTRCRLLEAVSLLGSSDRNIRLPPNFMPYIGSNLVKKYLVPVIMQFYVDIERTGGIIL